MTPRIEDLGAVWRNGSVSPNYQPAANAKAVPVTPDTPIPMRYLR